MLGLFLSSFALLVLQSTMGGLQYNLIERSKSLHGDGVLHFSPSSPEEVQPLTHLLSKHQINNFSQELELEILVKKGAFFSPVIIHGVESLPSALKVKDFNELVLGYGVSRNLNTYSGELVRLINPADVDLLFGNAPNMASLYLDESFVSDVQEIDSYHGYANLEFLQNFYRKRVVNRIRVFEDISDEKLNMIQKNSPVKFSYHSWEDQHQTLVKALSLENKMMIFLFSSMSLLIGLSISSAFLIFFNKIKMDLASFWILGSSKKILLKQSNILVHFISFVSIAFGVFVALGFLFLLDHYSPEIMPDVFVERKIPVRITPQGLLISFLTPYIISIIVSKMALRPFRRSLNFLSLLRAY